MQTANTKRNHLPPEPNKDFLACWALYLQRTAKSSWNTGGSWGPYWQAYTFSTILTNNWQNCTSDCCPKNSFPSWNYSLRIIINLLKTAREGNVFTGVCLSTIGLMDTDSLPGLVTTRSYRLECFLVAVCYHLYWPRSETTMVYFSGSTFYTIIPNKLSFQTIWSNLLFQKSRIWHYWLFL